MTQGVKAGLGGAQSAPSGPRPALRSAKRTRDFRPSAKASSWLLIAPAIVVLIAILGYPLLDVVLRSFTDPKAGLGNYTWFFTTDVNLTLMIRTFTTALIVTISCVLLAVPYVFLMTITKQRTTMIMLVLVLVPFWTSTIVRNFAWVVLMQEKGFLNSILDTLGLGQMTLIRTTPGVIIAMAQVLIPFMVLPLYGTMSKVDVRLIQAAKSLGARPSVAFLRVYFPLVRPGIVAGAVLVFVLSLGFYITPAMVGSNTNTLISGEIWLQINEQLAWGHGSAMGVVLLVVTLAVLGLAGLLFRGKAPLQGGTR